jgi:hypothetical protein
MARVRVQVRPVVLAAALAAASDAGRPVTRCEVP